MAYAVVCAVGRRRALMQGAACLLCVGLGATRLVGVPVERLVPHEGNEPGEATSNNPVYVEDSPAAEDLIRRADQWRVEGRWVEAARGFQRVVDEHPYKLVRLEKGGYCDAAWLVRRRLEEDGTLRSVHRRLFAPVADGLLRPVSFETDGPEDVDFLGDVVRRYPLCRAGLEAALQLAGWHLERAEPQCAAALLADVQDHPDVEAVRGRHHLLSAAAALFGGQPDVAARHREALVGVGADDALVQLDAWKAGLRPPPRPPVFSGGRSPAGVRWSPPERRPLWRHGISGPGLFAEPPQPVGGTATMSGAGSTMMPVGREERLFVNDGTSVFALQRDAGAMALWRYGVTTTRKQQMLAQRLARHRRGVQEPRSVALAGDRVLAVLGLVPTVQMPGGDTTWQTTLVALDAKDGALLWSLTPDQVGGAAAEAFFYGTPLVRDGQAHVLMRRARRSRFHDAYMAAVDVATGGVRWVRHLASAMPANQHFVETRPQLAADGGRVYVAETLGLVACLDARDGLVRWARVVERKITGRHAAGQPSASGAAHYATSPFRVAAGLVAHAGDRVLLLDPETGSHLRRFEAPEVLEAHYLAPWDGDILCVGPTMARLDGDSLEVVWRTPLYTGSEPLRATRPQGRGAIAGSVMVLPVEDHLFEIDLEAGAVVRRHSVEVSGHVLVVDHGVVVAGPREVCGYFAWPEALQRVRDRIEAQPDDPVPSLALAHVALGRKQHDVMLAAIDAALESLEHRHRALSDDGTRAAPADPMGTVVFDHLMQFADRKRVPVSEVRRAVFLRLAAVTSTPEAAVRFRMAHGDFLAETARYAEAMDQYQSVLDDRVLATSTYRTTNGAVQAGLEAQLRQETLIAAQDRSIYARIDQRAAMEFEQIGTHGGHAAADCLEVARRYPVSHAASRAVVAAARSLGAEGRRSAALALLRRTYPRAGNGDTLREVVSLLAALSVRDGRPNEARLWLRRAQRDHGPLTLTRDGRPIAVDAWIAFLETSGAAPGDLPRLELPLLPARAVKGRVMVPVGMPRRQWPRDRLVLLRKDHLVLLRGGDMQEAWRAELEAEEELTLLTLDQQQAVFWLPEDKALMVLDADSGQLQWRRPAAALMQGADPARSGQLDHRPERADAMPVARRQGLRIEAQEGQVVVVRDGGMPFRLNHHDFAAGRVAVDPGLKVAVGGQMRSFSTYALMVAVGHAHIVLADSSGHLTGVDRHSGKAVWHQRVAVMRATHLVLDEPSVAVVGTVKQSHEQVGSRIQVCHTSTGEMEAAPIDVDRPVRWLALRGGEGLWYIADGTVTAFGLVDGVTRWALERPQGAAPVGGWLHGDVLQMELPGRRLLSLNARTKQDLGDPLQLAGVRDVDGFDIQPVEGAWHVMERRSAYALSETNKLMWKDAVAEMNKQYVAQLIGARQVVVVHQVKPAQVRPRLMRIGGNQVRIGRPRGKPDADWKYRLYFFDRGHGLLLHEADVVLEPPPGPLQHPAALLLDNRIVLVGDTTAVLLAGTPSAAER